MRVKEQEERERERSNRVEHSNPAASNNWIEEMYSMYRTS